MSPWPRDRILAWLSPRAVVIAWQKVGPYRARIVAHRSRPLPEGSAGRDIGGCVSAFEAELERSAWRARALSVCVSDHFVRYAMLPWRPGLRSHADWDAYAAHEMEARYGSCQPLEIRIAPAAAGNNRLAASIDEELLLRLREASGRRQLLILALEPNACRVANCYRRKLGRRGHLLISEPGRATWLSVDDDRWTNAISVRNEHCAGLGALVANARLYEGYHPDTDKVWSWGPLDESAARAQLPVLERLEPQASTLQACGALGLL